MITVGLSLGPPLAFSSGAADSDLDLDVTSGLRFHWGKVIITTGIKAVAIVAVGVSPVGFLVSEMALLASNEFQHANITMPAGLEQALRQDQVQPGLDDYPSPDRHPSPAFI